MLKQKKGDKKKKANAGASSSVLQPEQIITGNEKIENTHSDLELVKSDEKPGNENIDSKKISSNELIEQDVESETPKALEILTQNIDIKENLGQVIVSDSNPEPVIIQEEIGGPISVQKATVFPQETNIEPPVENQIKSELILIKETNIEPPVENQIKSEPILIKETNIEPPEENQTNIEPILIKETNSVQNELKKSKDQKPKSKKQNSTKSNKNGAKKDQELEKEASSVKEYEQIKTPESPTEKFDLKLSEKEYSQKLTKDSKQPSENPPNEAIKPTVEADSAPNSFEERIKKVEPVPVDEKPTEVRPIQVSEQINEGGQSLVEEQIKVAIIRPIEEKAKENIVKGIEERPSEAGPVSVDLSPKDESVQDAQKIKENITALVQEQINEPGQSLIETQINKGALSLTEEQLKEIVKTDVEEKSKKAKNVPEQTKENKEACSSLTEEHVNELVILEIEQQLKDASLDQIEDQTKNALITSNKTNPNEAEPNQVLEEIKGVRETLSENQTKDAVIAPIVKQIKEIDLAEVDKHSNGNKNIQADQPLSSSKEPINDTLLKSGQDSSKVFHPFVVHEQPKAIETSSLQDFQKQESAMLSDKITGDSSLKNCSLISFECKGASDFNNLIEVTSMLSAQEPLTKSIEPALVEPLPVEPTPVEPVTVEPMQVEPTAVEPMQVEQTPVEPVPVEPVSVEPVPVEPVPVETVPVEPIQVEPVPVEPMQVKPANLELKELEPIKALETESMNAPSPIQAQNVQNASLQEDHIVKPAVLKEKKVQKQKKHAAKIEHVLSESPKDYQLHKSDEVDYAAVDKQEIKAEPFCAQNEAKAESTNK